MKVSEVIKRLQSLPEDSELLVTFTDAEGDLRYCTLDPGDFELVLLHKGAWDYYRTPFEGGTPVLAVELHVTT